MGPADTAGQLGAIGAPQGSSARILNVGAEARWSPLGPRICFGSGRKAKWPWHGLWPRGLAPHRSSGREGGPGAGGPYACLGEGEPPECRSLSSQPPQDLGPLGHPAPATPAGVPPQFPHPAGPLYLPQVPSSLSLQAPHHGSPLPVGPLPLPVHPPWAPLQVPSQSPISCLGVACPGRAWAEGLAGVCPQAPLYRGRGRGPGSRHQLQDERPGLGGAAPATTVPLSGPASGRPVLPERRQVGCALSGVLSPSPFNFPTTPDPVQGRDLGVRLPRWGSGAGEGAGNPRGPLWGPCASLQLQAAALLLCQSGD